jgi:hypothetical protein
MNTRHNPGDTVYLIHASKWAPRRMVTRKIVKITDAGYTLDKGARVSLDGCNRRSGFEGWATAEQVAEQKAAVELDRLRSIVRCIVNSADAATLNRALDAMRAPAVTLPAP